MTACPAQVYACAIRVARLEPNGVPDPGAGNLYVSDALVSLAVSVEKEEGDEIVVKNGCGAFCVNFKGPDLIKRRSVTLEICRYEPELFELLAGGEATTDGDGNIGYNSPRIGENPVPNGVSIELWAKALLSDGSADDPAYIWYVLPKVFLFEGDRTFNNGAASFPFEGFGIENENWFDGPANDWDVASDSGLMSKRTNTIPTAVCGAQSLATS
jgi:hypothetical protein